MTEMLAMGNYGAFVWSSYGLTFAVLIICIAMGRRRHARVSDEIRTRLRAMERES